MIQQTNSKKFFLELYQKLKHLMVGKKLFYKKNYAKTGINFDDDLPLKKQLKFPTLAIIIRFVLQNGEKLYPQIYQKECLYESVV